MPHLLTLLSSIVIVLAFTPWDIAPLAWIALVPWLFAMEAVEARVTRAKLAPRRAYWMLAREGLWFSFGMSVLGFYWVASVLIHFSGLHWSFGVFGLFLYAWFGQPQFALFALAWFALRRRGIAGRWGRLAPLGYALVYTAIDLWIPKLFVDTLGHSTYRAIHLRQAADLGGPALLTFAIAWVNFSLFEAAKAFLGRGEPSIWPALRKGARFAAPSVGFALLLTLYGIWRLEDIRSLSAKSDRVLRAGLIQANIGDFDKIASERGVRGAAEAVLSTFFRLTDQALARTPKPDLVIWPETSYPSTFRTPVSPEELRRDQMLEGFVRSRGVPLLFGGYDHSNGKDHNALFYLTPRPQAQTGDLQVYRKNILLVFGEYIPGAELIPWIKRTFPQVGNFGRGPGPQVFNLDLPRVGTVRTGPLICYEILFPSYVLQAARAGSELIVNITNDSWFGRYGEPDLHLSLSVFRGIEARIPQLRTTNTGITALISADGTIESPTDKFIADVGVREVRLAPRPVWTLMKAWGDWFPGFALAASLALVAWALRGAPQGRKRSRA